MKKKLCDSCSGTCDTPDAHCSVRLHMSYVTLAELIMLLDFSKRHLNLMVKLDYSVGGNEIDYLNCANHWHEHLSKVLLNYENTRNRAKSGRKFVVDRIHGYL